MRIGILTFHTSVNNGAVMQAYALSKRVQQDFPNSTVEIIDYRMRVVSQVYTHNLRSYFANSSPVVFVKKTIRLLQDPLQIRRMQKRTEIFRSCYDMLPLSKDIITDDDPNEIVQYINDHYDVLVVGSDAIWNYVVRGFPNAYLPDSRIRCKKISYAASCYGMDFLKRPDHEKSKIKDCLDDFSFIGVRDCATENFVRWSGCEKKLYHTCDPTAFLNVDTLPVDEVALKSKLSKRGFDFEKPTIAIMGDQAMLRMVRSLYKKKYQLVSLYNHIVGADVQLYDLTPYEWAYVFRYFKLVFTTYFHGTMLSLRNGTPLICVALNTDFAKSHTPKTLDVLQRIGLESWYFKTDYKTIGLEQIRKKADELLSADYKEMIVKAIDQEANSYQSVKDHLTDIDNFIK